MFLEQAQVSRRGTKAQRRDDADFETRAYSLNVKIPETSKGVWRRRCAARRGDAAAMLCIVAFFCLFFGWAIFRGHFLIGGDVFFYTYPLRSVAWEMIRQGQLPLWTPHVLSGYPLLSMAQLGLGYPLTWAHLFLPARHAELIYVLAPFLLAPAFTYAYLRELGRSRTAALLAGLSFAYGGLMTNTYGMNAIPTNALMWLPLLLIAIERVRTRGLARSVAAAALPCAMSVLTGHGQSFLFVCLLATAYALFLGFAYDAGDAQENRREHEPESEAGHGRARRRAWFGWQRWSPLLASTGGMLLAAGIAAFQILETMRAARRSIRSNLSYEFFVEGSFTPLAAWRSFVAPLYHFIEVTTYISPLAFACAVCAVAFNLRRGRRQTPHRAALTIDVQAGTDARVFFWAATALVAVLLMLGGNTPLYRALHQVPVFNLFRRPSRHVFEWTFALSVLAAYGWDALDSFSRRGVSGARGGVERGKLVVATLSLLIAAALGVVWWQTAHGLPYVGDAVPRAESIYLKWKILFTLALAVACGFALRLSAARRRRAWLLACVVLLACFVESHLLVTHWWPGTIKTTERLTTPARATRYLQQFPAHENRVYVRANSGEEESAAAPRFDALNLTARYGLHNVAGYEALLFERYSRALGDVDYDAVNPRRGARATLALFAPRSHVLDLLNTTRVVTFANLATTPTVEARGAEADGDALDATRWQREEEFDGVLVLRNERALPRAWLVGEAEALDGEEALRRIRGESLTAFDPRRTALLEVKPEEL
ncbi:MAG TPA: hypothetical protein VGB76_10770, partial [Pyrinomonadaceae bacterium]